VNALAATKPLALRVGKSRTLVEVADYDEASRIYCELRERSGLGASRMPGARLYQGRQVVAELSYNGKVWDRAGRCVFNPYEGGGISP